MNIRNIQVAFFAACLLLSMSAFTTSAFAVNIAVVDVERVLAESKAAKSVQKQMDKKRKNFLADVKKAEEKLRKNQESIEKKRADLSKEDFLSKIQSFERERIKARNSVQEKKASLDKNYTKAMNTLTKTIFDVCQEIADEDGIDLIITRQNIIVGSKSLDITAKVMERMNKKLPKLTIK